MPAWFRKLRNAFSKNPTPMVKPVLKKGPAAQTVTYEIGGDPTKKVVIMQDTGKIIAGADHLNPTNPPKKKKYLPKF